jgi:hypothetical protein
MKTEAEKTENNEATATKHECNRPRDNPKIDWSNYTSFFFYRQSAGALAICFPQESNEKSSASFSRA